MTEQELTELSVLRGIVKKFAHAQITMRDETESFGFIIAKLQDALDEAMSEAGLDYGRNGRLR